MKLVKDVLYKVHSHTLKKKTLKANADKKWWGIYVICCETLVVDHVHFNFPFAYF